ncbi:MAG TPA: M20 family peptidase [Burkholderiales bacterium]|nr:M20 family peptidase [Burkholderiales bacterium]
MKKLSALLLCAFVALLAVLGFNTWRAAPPSVEVAPATPLTLDTGAAAQRLGDAVRIATVSSASDPQANAPAFEQLRRHLETSFPRVHASLKRERIGESLLYTWPGSDASLKPLLLMAHMDVVPVDPASAGAWQQPPFSGAVQDGFIWGRGAWDDKGNLLSQLEAIEALLASGYTPRRSVTLFSGADEEVGGTRGAKAAVALLQQRGLHFDFVLDEGLVVTQGIIPGVAAPAALIGIAQKGYVSIELAAQLPAAGHSSMPPIESAIGILTQALARLQAREYETRLDGVPAQMLERLGPQMAWSSRVVMANLWLFRPLVAGKLAAADSTRAQLHTTMALTMIEGGIADNVLPTRARAMVNFRLMPGTSVQSVAEHVRGAIKDPRISVSVQTQSAVEPGRVSSTDAPAYQAIEKSIREVFRGAAVAPGLLAAHADAGYFEPIADNVYLFSPVRAGPQDTERVHGINERIAVPNYVEMINFYARLLRNAAS